MPHSTTGTTSYVLQKYSRAYPKKRGLAETQVESQNSTDVVSEWQHFTNPTIRLVLEVRKSADGNTESVRLRIIWQMNADLDYGNSQQDVTFEDLDLLSFSDMLTAIPRKPSLEGLPLKAVYRDTVVGIRYLFNRELGEPLAYRRFQISFQTAAEAFEFIETIKPVCPCKVNPAPVQAPQQAQAQNAAMRSKIQQNTMRPPPLVPQPTIMDLPRTNQDPTALHVSQQITPMVYAPLPVRPNPQMVAHIASSSSGYDLSSSPVRRPQDVQGHILSSSGTFPQHPSTVSQATAQHHMPPPSFNEPTQNSRLGPTSSFPASSVSQSSVEHTQRHDGSLQVAQPIEVQTVLRSDNVRSMMSELADSASIYDLSASALERAVGEIIREEGFLQMVERIAEMMTIRRVART